MFIGVGCGSGWEMRLRGSEWRDVRGGGSGGYCSSVLSSIIIRGHGIAL